MRAAAMLRPFVVAALATCAVATWAAPKVILISLDGASPRLVEHFIREGSLPRDEGLGLLMREGAWAERNVTVNPSLTAPSHIAIATGSIAARNDIPANTYHLHASPFATTISGFGGPIGGYTLTRHGPEESAHPTSEPLWLALRAANRKVVAATFPGADGVDVRVPGFPNSPIIQSFLKRTVDYTVPFGAFGGIGAQGFTLTAVQFGPAAPTALAQLKAAGKVSFSQIQQTSGPIETVTVGGVIFNIWVAALDTTDDSRVNYDTLVFFDPALGIRPGPFSPPATGPAYVKAADGRSQPFYFEGSSTRAGAAYYVTLLAPDLSTVHVVRYSANFIPRNTPVLADVDDINNNVGFWRPQADFRIPERLSPGFENFSDLELEAAYEDQVRTFVEYQTRVALRAIARNNDADLVMAYIEQPDGSGHQFTMTDPRQASNPRDPSTIGANQDPAKRARYLNYLRLAYAAANEAVQRIIDEVGRDRYGRPNSNIIVVSDHGMAPFHTAVDLNAYLAAKGFDPAKVRATTSGPAANIYINLQGREAGGTVTRQEYLLLQDQLAAALRELADSNPNYVRQGQGGRVFDQLYRRPTPQDIASEEFGVSTNNVIGQDSGDVYAVLALGYNFDGTQVPVVRRLGDPAAGTAVLSVPNFYGAHGYDPRLPEMSAIFYAAGPDICRERFETVRNIDIAPTILDILNVRPADTVQGRALRLCGGGRR